MSRTHGSEQDESATQFAKRGRVHGRVPHGMLIIPMPQIVVNQGDTSFVCYVQNLQIACRNKISHKVGTILVNLTIEGWFWENQYSAVRIMYIMLN